jgi:SAM-dependent methyltransferase
LKSGEPPLLWLRFEHEAQQCPACGSPELSQLDVFKISRDAQGRRVSFVTGCRGCGLLFANPLPTRADLDALYAEDGKWVEGRKTRATKSIPKPATQRDPRDVLLEALAPYVPVTAPPPGARVLDFGCGDGKFLDRLQRWGWETHGIEPSTTAAFARHGRLERPPQDGSFDFVILHHVLEHVIEPFDILRELAASLRPGGVLFAGVPRVDTLPDHGDFKYCLDGRHHIMCLSDACLRGLMARSGLETIARLDARELDAELTAGKPRRLRLVAKRTDARLPLPDAPLRQGAGAVRRFARNRDGLAGMLGGLLPVRMRGALLDRSIERRARERRRARARG